MVNTLRPRQNGHHFADDIFKCIFLNENAWISIKISLKFILQGPINNIPALVQIMAWRRPGDKPLSGPMMVRLPTHICVTRPQWVNQHCGHWCPGSKASGIQQLQWWVTTYYSRPIPYKNVEKWKTSQFTITFRKKTRWVDGTPTSEVTPVTIW